METAAAIIKNLYNDFLLRDFFGKMIPGSILIFSVLSLFTSPRAILRTINAERSVLGLVVLGGLAWTTVLGLQSLAERIGVWEYYPSRDVQEPGQPPLEEMKVQIETVAPFLRIACEGEKNQYERYVVIKEATGNLFICLMLSTPLLLAALARRKEPIDASRGTSATAFHAVRAVLLVLCWAVVAAGLFAMNRQHVDKQYYFAKGMLHRFGREPCRDKGGGRPTREPGTAADGPG